MTKEVSGNDAQKFVQELEKYVDEKCPTEKFDIIKEILSLAHQMAKENWGTILTEYGDTYVDVILTVPMLNFNMHQMEDWREFMKHSDIFQIKRAEEDVIVQVRIDNVFE